jgi:hypothetical protein
MNILNRLFAIVLLLVAVAAVTLVAALPAEALGVTIVGLAWLKGLADRLLPAGRLAVAAAGLALDLVLLFWLWLEIRRPRYRTVQVNRADGAAAEVTTETLTERLEYAVDALPGVVQARARVRSYGKSVAVTIEAEITPETPVAVTASKIAATVSQEAEAAMGLALRGKPKVHIKAIRLQELTPELLAEEAAQEEAARLALRRKQVTELPSPPPS